MTGQDIVRDATIAELAAAYGVGEDAVRVVMSAVNAGGGRAAQFNHPDLGGMGQWSQGGMIMIGDMFNNALKERVSRLCADIAGRLADGSLAAAPPSSGHDEWPAELGAPAATGAQNDMRYAFFPTTRRLAIERDGHLSLFDTADHRLTGFSQQQSSGQDLAFTTPDGPVRLDMLREVRARAAAPAAAPAPPPEDGDVYAKLERLHELHLRGVLSEPEYAAKKAELLSRI